MAQRAPRHRRASERQMQRPFRLRNIVDIVRVALHCFAPLSCGSGRRRGAAATSVGMTRRPSTIRWPELLARPRDTGHFGALTTRLAVRRPDAVARAIGQRLEILATASAAAPAACIDKRQPAQLFFDLFCAFRDPRHAAESDGLRYLAPADVEAERRKHPGYVFIGSLAYFVRAKMRSGGNFGTMMRRTNSPGARSCLPYSRKKASTGINRRICPFSAVRRSRRARSELAADLQSANRWRHFPRWYRKPALRPSRTAA